jgi:transposase InsO family protein
MKAEYPIRPLCAVLEVGPSGYYDWRHRQNLPAPRTQQDEQLLVRIEQIFLASRRTYGSPRVQIALERQGRHHGRNRIGRLMRQKGLVGRQRQRYRVRTTDSDHDQPVAPNRLAQQPVPTQLNQVWVADITYVPTGEGWLYVAGILDLYSRRLVGLAMGSEITTALTLAAWQQALTHRQPPRGLIFHSDRGVQYASRDYRRALAQVHALASMSRKACCYDNAAMESFWSTLKHELVYRSEFASRAQAQRAIFEYVEIFYNRQRLHSALGYYSPIDFEYRNN